MKTDQKIPVIDCHAHVFPDKIAEKAVEFIGLYYGIKMTGTGTLRDLLRRGREICVKKYLIHSTATKPEQVTAINNFISSSLNVSDKFIGFGTIHPGFNGLEEEIERIPNLGLKGIKLHPEFQNFSIDEHSMFPVYRASEGKLPILMHMGDENGDSSSPLRLAKILEQFPNLTVIAAHLGGYRMWKESSEYLAGSNVYFDTCSSMPFLDKKDAVEIIQKHGTDRVLFGTDYPMWDHGEEYRLLMKLGLPEEDNQKILYKNACRLLHIDEGSIK